MTEEVVDVPALRAEVIARRRGARAMVRRYADVRATDVPPLEVAAIVRALGDISVNEACESLDRLQRKHRR